MSQHLTEKSPAIAQKYVLNGITLLPHQLTAIKRLIMISTNKYEQHNDVEIVTSQALLSEPFGSGKTFIILAYLLLQPIPRMTPETFMFNNNVVTRSFTDENALIPAAVIHVGSGVLKQWLEKISMHTKLNTFVVGGYYDLVRFKELINTGEVKNYDIFLVKNGMVGGDLSFIPNHDRSIMPVINAFTNLAAGYCFAHCVYDDYDSINIPQNAKCPSALFHIYVSATNKAPNFYYNNSCKKEEFPFFVRPSILQFKYNNKYNFEVHNSKKFIDQSIALPRVIKTAIKFKSFDDGLINLIGVMDNNSAADIVEMLNGDAIETAAAKAGIVTHSIGGIFEKLLGRNYNTYRSCSRRQKYLEKVANYIVDNLEFDTAKLSNTAVAEFERRLKLQRGIEEVLTHINDDIDKIMVEAQEKNDAALKDARLAIDRVVDNLQGGICQICRLPLQGRSMFVSKCCGSVWCEICGFKGNNIRAQTLKNDQSVVMGRCANCRKAVNLTTDMLLITKDIDTKALSEDIEEENVDEEITESTSAPAELNIKTETLVRLIKHLLTNSGPFEVEDGCEIVNNVIYNVDNLLEGTKDKPEITKRKFLIFASYDESLENVIKSLNAGGINYLMLRGTYQEMARIMVKYRDSDIPVLLVNSRQNCAGLDIQFCTDIMFVHRIKDPAIESQVLGRGCRIGRTCNLTAWWFLYSNEYVEMFKSKREKQ